jgi:CBS domain-containing protein
MPMSSPRPAREDPGMHVQELMTRKVVTVEPATSLKQVARLLSEHRISGMPVCEGGHVLGVVSEADILWHEQGFAPERSRFFAWLVERSGGDETRLAARTAGEAMTSPAVTVGPRTPTAAAARLMVERRVKRLPVVEDGLLVGVVSRGDLVRAFHRSDAEITGEIRDDLLLRVLWIDPNEIDVRVQEGEVTLSGTVETRTAAEVVDAYVRRVPGVVDVLSNLAWRVDDLSRRTRRSANHAHGAASS